MSVKLCYKLPNGVQPNAAKYYTAVSSEAWAKLRDWASVAGRGRLLLSGSVAHASLKTAVSQATLSSPLDLGLHLFAAVDKVHGGLGACLKEVHDHIFLHQLNAEVRGRARVVLELHRNHGI